MKHTKRTTRSRVTKCVKPNRVQAKPKSDGKQLLLTNLPPPLTCVKCPAQDTFDFKFSTTVPSSCDSVVREYDSCNSPHSTPSKRSSPKGKSIAAKRKCSTQSVVITTPQTDNIPQSCIKPCSTRKRLEMPNPTVVVSSSNGKDDVTEVTTTDARVGWEIIILNVSTCTVESMCVGLPISFSNRFPS